MIGPLTEQPEIRAGSPGDTAAKELSYRCVHSGQQLLQTRCNGMGAAHAASPRRHERRPADRITRDRQATTLATTPSVTRSRRSLNGRGVSSQIAKATRPAINRLLPRLTRRRRARPTRRSNEEGIVRWHETKRRDLSAAALTAIPEIVPCLCLQRAYERGMAADATDYGPTAS